MDLTDKQKSVLYAKHKRINILSGAVRSGKTFILNYIICWLVYNAPQGKGALIARTLETLRENILDPMKIMLGDSFDYADGGRRIMIDGRRIRGVGFNDAKSVGRIQGDTLSFAVGDEVTLWPEESFKMLMSRLSLPGSMFFGSCNPDSPYHWLKTNFIDKADKLDLVNYHFIIDDNDTLDKKFVENLKKEYTGIWYQRYISGLWVLADGIIYDMFDEHFHVKRKPIEQYRNAMVACDYGTSNPCVFLCIRYNSNSDIYVSSEYSYDGGKPNALGVTKQKTDAEYVSDMEKFFLSNKLRKYSTVVFIDPSALSFITALRQAGFMAEKARNDVSDGIRFISACYAKQYISISPDCTGLIKDHGIYIWDSKAQKQGIDAPVKMNDHTLDALRYGIYTKFGGKNYVEPTQETV